MHMKGKQKPVLFMLLFAGLILFVMLLLQPAQIRFIVKRGFEIAVLMPRGIIALKERNLLLFIQVIMLLVIIPVYFLTFVFSWRYREHNKAAKYTPEWDHSHLAEYLWWGIPCLFTLIIIIFTWLGTYQLDPFRSLNSDKQPLTIQVIALQWKWLFIYPEEKIATLNFVHFPKQVPIHFEITSDAPMNSLWIPQLGGQIYAMPKMRTELHLMADQEGDYRGSSANLSGEGFAGMHFVATALGDEEYHNWVQSVKRSANLNLNLEEYNQLALPSKNNPLATYLLKEEDLFHQVIRKYMAPEK
jgi:cytochrome o ubiquinol oxidase subunit II